MKYKKYLIAISVFILIILLKGYLFQAKYVSDNYLKEYTLFIQNLNSKSDTKISYNVKLLETQDKFILNIYSNSYTNTGMDLSKYSNYKYGDVIKIKGKISIPKKLNNPGEFNYKLYLYSNNIHGLINTYDTPAQMKYKLNLLESVNKKVYEFKEYVQNIIQSSMNIPNSNVAISMIYGNKVDLDEDIKRDLDTIGVSHLMSVSGTHITSFMLVINIILGLNKGKRKSRNVQRKHNNMRRTSVIIKGIVQIICILTYMVFVGIGVSVLRAGIMLIVSVLYNMFGKRNRKYIGVIISLCVVLFVSPYSIFNTGMQLSFLASLGIIVFWKEFTKIFCKTVNNISNKIIRKIVEYILENIAITVAVQLVIVPIQIQVFNKLPVPIILPNLILGIISVPIRIIGTFGIILFFIPILASKLFRITEIFVVFLIKAVNIFKEFSFGINLVSMPAIFFVIYYLFVGLLALYLKIKRMVGITERMRTKFDFERTIKYIKILIILLLVSVIGFVILLNVHTIYISKYVYFFNVEQGDMSYIKYKKASVLVDIGCMREGIAFNTISNYFKANNITRVDAIVISHMHKDHINGLEKFLEKYKVGQVIYAKPKHTSENYEYFLNVLDKYNITKKQVKSGDRITIGKIEINILLPDTKYIQSEDEENANSLVCKISVNKKELLYMGDGSMETEEKLLSKNYNIGNVYILKVGHHGSKTATSEAFIQKVKPQNAVISAHKRYYGHPHENTIDTLKQNNVWLYLTEKHGAIKFSLF